MEYVKIERRYSSFEKRMNFRSLAVWKRFETTTFGYSHYLFKFKGHSFSDKCSEMVDSK